MNENYKEEKNIIPNKNELLESQQDKLFPLLFKSKKYKILQKQKEISNSLSINDNNILFSLGSTKLKKNYSLSNINKSYQENQGLLLPRISSADLVKNNINKNNQKKNFNSFQNKNKNKYLPPRPNISNNNKQLKFNSELLKLKKENEYLITELERLNIELRNLIDKKMKIIKAKKRFNTEGKRLELNKENEIKANRKYLHTLITEYNQIYKNFSIGQNKNNINNLEKELKDLKKSNNDNKKTSKILKEEIYKNERTMENNQKIRKNQIINLNDSENKYIMCKNKLIGINKENERMSKLLINEEKKIQELKISYINLEKVLNYKETEEIIKKMNEEEIKNKELQKLINKKEILIHARLSMKKRYTNKIESQVKDIKKLNSTLDELNREIESIHE